MNFKIDDSGRPYPIKNSKGKVIMDCAVRAIANFLELPYPEVEELLLAETNYDPYGGIYNEEMIEVLKPFGFTYHKARVRINSATAINKLPRRCILRFCAPSLGFAHVAFYEDGVITDTAKLSKIAGTRQTVGYFTAD